MVKYPTISSIGVSGNRRVEKEWHVAELKN
jgi:hypothetical protein